MGNKYEKEYTVMISVEKVIEVKVLAENEEEAIAIANTKIMHSTEDFAQILDSYIEE